jgi:hypothetical protein
MLTVFVGFGGEDFIAAVAGGCAAVATAGFAGKIVKSPAFAIPADFTLY